VSGDKPVSVRFRGQGGRYIEGVGEFDGSAPFFAPRKLAEMLVRVWPDEYSIVPETVTEAASPPVVTSRPVRRR